MRRVRRRGTESPAVPIEDQGQVAAWSLYNFAAHGWAAAVAAVLIGPWMLSLATNAVGKHGVLIAIGPVHLRAEAYPSAMLTVAAIVQFLVLPLAGAAGLPPLDRTPVYAACWLCQNSSNSLGDM